MEESKKCNIDCGMTNCPKNTQVNMKEFIKELIDKYSKRVEKDIIGCGLDSGDNASLDNAIEVFVDKLFDEMVGTRPTRDCAAPEYEQWYRKFLVFCEVMKKFGKKYDGRYIHFPTPKNLANSYGPRD